MNLQAWLMKNSMWSFVVSSMNGKITLYTEVKISPLTSPTPVEAHLIIQIHVTLQVN